MEWKKVPATDGAAVQSNEIEENVEGDAERAARSVFLAASTGSVNLGFCWEFISEFTGRL